MSEKKSPEPTRLNLATLASCVAAAPGGVIERVAPTDTDHLRRCIAAGLLEPAGRRGAWKLSAAGNEALKR
jgi:hypothetical protein